jgi:2-iminoacetate synthase
MQVAKNGTIQNLCQPNALMTLSEYLEDYCDDELKALGNKVIEANIDKIPSDKMRAKTIDRLQRISDGERDLFF